MTPFNMKLAKVTGAGTRPRGNDHNRYHLYSRRNQHPRHCLNLIFTFITSCIVLSSLGAGLLLAHQPVTQECNISFIPRPFDEPHFSEQTGSQYRDLPVLLVLSLLALLTWISSRTITALAQGLSGDPRLPQSPLVHHPEQSWVQDRVFLYKRSSIKTTITILSYLAVGFFAAILLTRSRTHSEESDFCPFGAHYIQKLQQTLKRVDIRVLAVALIAPSSSDHSTLEKKIVDYFIPLFKIEGILKMDRPGRSNHGIYQPTTDRMGEYEALTSRDSDSESADKTESVNLGREAFPTDTGTSSARPTVTWALDLETNPSNQWNQARMQSKRREEVDGSASVGISFNVRSSSLNAGSPIQIPIRDLSSGCLNAQESLHSPSPGGPIRSAIRKTKSSIFRHTASQEDAEIPPMPKQGFVSRATNNIFRNNASRREHTPVVGGRSISNPEAQGPTGVMLLRDVEMEEKARAMGFTLPPNRFGFQEKLIGDGALPMESADEVSSTAGTIAGPAIVEHESDYTDDELTVFGESGTEAMSENQGLPTPPLVGKSSDPENEGGLDDLEESHFDNMAWLKNCFAPSKTDLLKDFGSPPQVEAHPPHSHPASNMAAEPSNSLCELDAPPMIGSFDTSEAKVVQTSSPGYSQPDQGQNREVTKLRGEIRMLVEKLLAMDSEMERIKARESAARERVSMLEKMLESYGIPFEDAQKHLDNDDVFDLAANNSGAYQTPTRAGFTLKSKSSSGGESAGNRPSHKKSKSQESGFFKSLRGTTEPSLVAFEKLKERSLLDANADEKDPDLASKLKVSSRQLPPNAPKPASKEPVPKAKGGASSMLRRLSSLDNLKRKDAKGAGSSDPKNYSGGNSSQNSQYSQSKDASLISIIEESTGGLKSADTASGTPSRREKVTSFSEDSSLPANHQRHTRSSGALTGQYGSDLSLALANITSEKSQQKGRSGAIPSGWEYMGTTEDFRQAECDEPRYLEEEYDNPTGKAHLSRATFDPSAESFAYEDRAILNEECSERVLRSIPPTRSPPARPGLLTNSSEEIQGSGGRHEAQEDQRCQAWPPTTPERFNLNKSLPEIKSEDGDKEEGSKDRKKRGLRTLFTRK